MKKYIPNILTTYRAIAALFIPFLFLKSNYLLFIIFVITVAISDALDGPLSRKWDVVSNYGKLLDAIGDKLFALSSLLTLLIFNNYYFYFNLGGEVLIILVNLYVYIFYGNFKKKNFNNRNSSIYGKIKTWFLFTTLVVGYIAYKAQSLNYILLPLIFITFILQLITSYNYFKNRSLTK